MKLFDIIYFSLYNDIVINKKNTSFGVLFFASFIYMNLISTFLNLLSILIDYRILKNVSYNLFIYILIFIINYIIYEKFNRIKSIKIKVIKSLFINILFFVSAFLFFFTIYLNNEVFN
ncbi:Hypothetical transmembrane protein [Flavobacterium indicum GPTSA100-9 = DSM 17447]|uniref:Hypothetical transmembrane protein n=1 Tax=Flavobacterium indicum (strain DSM 17447 / CIP 109464 / GPTSA100-9) TaxID=1094466 RepID=H8XST1_FLAIG|nr:Hypothetical transmembrane protein [Flavobacterium indicum GPTSA100-9 = DSM 17447]